MDSEDIFDEVLDRLVLSGEVKIWKAKELVSDLTGAVESKNNINRKNNDDSLGIGYGKVIILGEHAVGYGKHAIAAPLPLKIKAHLVD